MVGEWSKKAYLLSPLLYLPYKEGRIRLGRSGWKGEEQRAKVGKGRRGGEACVVQLQFHKRCSHMISTLFTLS